MSRFRFSWAMGAVAPWCLGVGLVVSMAANAGQDAMIGASLAPAADRAVTQPGNLIPFSATGIGFGLNLTGNEQQPQEATLQLGDPSEFDRVPDEIEPRATLKHASWGFPAIDRTHKGDPIVGLRPTFDTELRRRGGLNAFRAHDLLFADNEVWPSSAFAREMPENDADTADKFEPWPDGETPTTVATSADISPLQQGSLITMRPAAINEQLMQGATPSVPRATALASTTPAPADATPIEVVALPTMPKDGSPENSVVATARPTNDLALNDEEQSAHEQRCLAEAIYFEARGESEEGQAAVAQVVLNRVASGLYPSTVCGVVYQNRWHYHACQFSFACEGRSLRISEPEAWQTARRIAAAVTSGQTYVADVGDATHYHADYVHPFWARRLEKTDVIGHHVFYKLRPGQT